MPLPNNSDLAEALKLNAKAMEAHTKALKEQATALHAHAASLGRVETAIEHVREPAIWCGACLIITLIIHAILWGIPKHGNA